MHAASKKELTVAIEIYIAYVYYNFFSFLPMWCHPSEYLEAIVLGVWLPFLGVTLAH